jgi:Polysaccharide pyruvyl transferase
VVAAEVRDAVLRFSARRQAELVPVPIARGQARDATVLRELFAGVGTDGGADLASPAAVVAQVGRCRLLVTGAYHAAVFALAQGVPAICLARSDYYRQKFEGLVELFGPGCELVALDHHELAERLQQAMETAWLESPRLRSGLRRAAQEQIARGWSAYRQLTSLITSRSRIGAGLAGIR